MNKKGFTMIELLVAVAIMGILTIIAIPSVKHIQSNNQKTKYVSYEKAITGASKLYVDSYTEDLFGIDNTGCAIIKYKDLKERDLIQDIQLNNTNVNEDNTFIMVTKTKENNYNYDTHVLITDNENNALYGENSTIDLSTICKLEDGKGPDLEIYEVDNKQLFVEGQEPHLKVKIFDYGVGLKSNQKLHYKWYKNGEEISESEKLLKFNNKNYDKDIIKNINVPDSIKNSNEDAIYTVVFNGELSDINNNKSHHTYEDKVWSKDVLYMADRCQQYIVKYNVKIHGSGKDKSSKTSKPGTNYNEIDAVANKWYNTSLNVGMEFRKITLPALKNYTVSNYDLYASENGDDYKLIKDKITTKSKELIETGARTNGTIRYNVKYKIKGINESFWCSKPSDKYKLDHIAPAIRFANERDNYLLNVNVTDDHSGIVSYQWGTEGYTLIAATDAFNNSRYYGSSAGGTLPFTAIDAAGNVGTESTPTYKWCSYTKYFGNGPLPSWNEIHRIGGANQWGGMIIFRLTYKDNTCGTASNKSNRRRYDYEEYGCQCRKDFYNNKFCYYDDYADYSSATHERKTASIYYYKTTNGVKACNAQLPINSHVIRFCTVDGTAAGAFQHGYYFYSGDAGAYKNYRPDLYWQNWLPENPENRISRTASIGDACVHACKAALGSNV